MVRPLVLASASPRRSELLQQLGVTFTCEPADIDETPLAHESPQDYVERMAREKALSVAAHHGPNPAVLGADTTVVIDGDILGKPADRMAAMATLARLSGREHSVFTAVCIACEGATLSALVETAVIFSVLDQPTVEAYLDSGEPFDKAGSYGIQGLGGALVSAIRGSYSNVVGLPLAQTRELLTANGVATALDTATEGARRTV